jgi:hypothetical protein
MFTKVKEKNNSSTYKAIAIAFVILLLCLTGYLLFFYVVISNFNPISTTTPTSASSTDGYYLSHGDFSVYFPAQPTYSVTSQELTAGNNVTDDNYSWGQSDGFWQYPLVATYVASPFPNSSLTPREKLESEMQYTSGNSTTFNLISSTSTTVDGFPAIAYVGQSKSNPAAYYIGKDVLTNHGLYMIEYYYSGQEDKQLENNFLNSLTFGTPTNTNEPKAPSSPSQPTDPQSQSAAPISGNLTTALINRIEPSIVEINCYSANGNVVVSGSGTSNLNDGTLYITTNYHVYNGAKMGGGLPTCYAVFPEPPNFSYNGEYGDYQLSLANYNYNPNTYEDVAQFTLGAIYPSATALSSIPSINNLPLAGMGAAGCPDAVVGDSVTVFGYPSSGNLLGISETVTKGTIAGILAGPIYKFDGAIDHGNSGGLAVLDKDSCVLGIPTLGDSGLTAGIGYIQSFQLASQAVTLTPNQICERDIGTGSYYLGYDNPNGTLACSSSY